MQRYLFQVSIGPVQDFISAARRTRDLKFGSDLLSELSKAAANAITAANAENVLIFPAPTDSKSLEPNTDFNVANKIVAIVNNSPNDLSRIVYDAIRARLLKFRTDAKGFRELPDADQKIADAQLNDLVEYFWVALPFQEGRYKVTRENLEALMAARKNTRDFSPVSWGSKQPKSSIDGHLESVIPETWYPHRWENLATQRAKANNLFKSFHAKPGEHLSGVDLLKRNGPLEGDSFPSTSHFATIPFLQRLEALDGKAKEHLKLSWDAYIQKIGAVVDRIEYMPRNSPLHPILGKCEGSMLFEERFPDLVDINDDMSIFKEAKQALQEFFQKVDDHFPNASPKVRPGIYYAILLADGDSMGKVIDHQAAAANGAEPHRDLSKALANFSGKVRAIVEGQEALGLARNAEKSAKHVQNKNALAILISKRSGSDFSIKGHWPDWKQEAPQTPVSFAEHLKELIQFCRQESIPKGTAYELRDVALRLDVQADISEDDSNIDQTEPTMQTAIKTEAKRILERKLTHHRRNNPDDDEEEARERHQRITKLLDQIDDVKDFAYELIAAQFFADAMELAQPTKGTQQ